MIWLVECRRGKKALQPGNILLLSRTLQGTDDLGNTKLWGELPGLTSTSPATGAEVSHWQFWSRAEGLNSAPVVLWDAQGSSSGTEAVLSHPTTQPCSSTQNSSALAGAFAAAPGPAASGVPRWLSGPPGKGHPWEHTLH